MFFFLFNGLLYVEIFVQIHYHSKVCFFNIFFILFFFNKDAIEHFKTPL